MSRVFVFFLLFLILYFILKTLWKGLWRQSMSGRENPETEELVQDPCCLAYISKRHAIHKKVSGKDCYFCNRACLENYLKSEKKG